MEIGKQDEGLLTIQQSCYTDPNSCVALTGTTQILLVPL